MIPLLLCMKLFCVSLLMVGFVLLLISIQYREEPYADFVDKLGEFIFGIGMLGYMICSIYPVFIKPL